MSTITTNNVPRHVVYGFELTPKERREFDYYDNSEELDAAEFVRYKGWVYDLREFERSNVKGWDGQHCDTFFSAVIFRYVREEWGEIDPEHVVMGLYFAG